MDSFLEFEGAVFQWPDRQYYGRVLEARPQPAGPDRLVYDLTIERPDDAPVKARLEVLLENQDKLEGESSIDRANVVLRAVSHWVRTQTPGAGPYTPAVSIGPTGTITVR